jgi:hypothetical protein
MQQARQLAIVHQARAAKVPRSVSPRPLSGVLPALASLTSPVPSTAAVQRSLVSVTVERDTRPPPPPLNIRGLNVVHKFADPVTW